MNDTSPEIAELIRQRMMERSGEERFLMGVQMFDVARQIMISSFPESLSPIDKKKMIYARTYGHPAPAGAVAMWIEAEAEKNR